MARLSKEIKASVKVGDEEVVFTLRQPTNKEINDFLGKRYQVKGRKMDDKSVDTRIELFDTLLTDVQNLEDADGLPVTVDRKELIPGTWKNSIIFQQLESVEVDLKN